MATTTSPQPTASIDAQKARLLVRFTPTSDMTNDQYDETMRRLEKSGDWMPDGLEFHVAFRSAGDFRVSEIWDSREQLDAFSDRLMPVLKDVGIELSGQPEVLEIHNLVTR
jgi:hypothetical protein